MKKRFFASANTGRGFKSYFDEIVYDKKMPYLEEKLTEIYNDSTLNANKTKPKDITNQSNNKTENTSTQQNNNTQYSPDQKVYKVQIYSSDKKLDLNSAVFKNYQVEEYFHGGLYKYTTGSEIEFSKIQELYYKAKADFKTCFIVEFKNGERIK